MRVADRLLEARVDLAAVEDHLLGIDVLDGAERHREIARIFDIDDDTVRMDLPYRAEGLLAVMHEHVEPFLDLFHTRTPWIAGTGPWLAAAFR
jgi:hypothetical protein